MQHLLLSMSYGEHQGPFWILRCKAGDVCSHLLKIAPKSNYSYLVVLPVYQALKVEIWKNRFRAEFLLKCPQCHCQRNFNKAFRENCISLGLGSFHSCVPREFQCSFHFGIQIVSLLLRTALVCRRGHSKWFDAAQFARTPLPAI